jgi:hypothetical protein
MTGAVLLIGLLTGQWEPGPASDTNPVVQDFVRCCLDNKPTQ